jgi:hypothetical protein
LFYSFCLYQPFPFSSPSFIKGIFGENMLMWLDTQTQMTWHSCM